MIIVMLWYDDHNEWLMIIIGVAHKFTVICEVKISVSVSHQCHQLECGYDNNL